MLAHERLLLNLHAFFATGGQLGLCQRDLKRTSRTRVCFLAKVNIFI